LTLNAREAGFGR